MSPAVQVQGSSLPAPACNVAVLADAPDSVHAPVQALAPAWKLSAPAGWTMSFEGVQDADGSLYWQESRAAGQPGFAVASATRDGAVRWRVDPGAAARVWLVSAGRVVVSLGGDPSFPGHVASLDAATGAVTWTVDLGTVAALLVPADRGPARGYVRVDHPSVLSGVVTFPVSAVDQPGYVWPGLLRVDLASGAIRELRALATDLTIWIPGEPAATSGATYAIVRPTQLSAALLAFGADGAPRVALPLSPDDNLWVVGATDRHVVATGVPGAAPSATGPPFLQWSALDGTPLGRVAAVGVTDFLSAGGVAFTVGGGRVARLDLDGCAAVWQRTLARVAPSDRFTQRFLSEAWPIRTAGGGVLVAFQPLSTQGTSDTAVGETAWVVELGPGGDEVFRGQLPAGFLYGGPATLQRGRWITTVGTTVMDHQLAAFDLAGQDAAATGWITREGNLARERAAR